MQKSVSIIMLVYNEAEIIEDVIREYWEKVASKLENCEFIIAEDGSNDGTKEILERVATEIPIKLVMGNSRKGYVNAYREAMRLPEKEYIFFTDSSGKHNPADFWDMYKKISNYDIISGYKVKRKDPFYRIVLTKGFNFCVNIYFGTSIKDIDSGFKIISKNAMEAIINDQWIVKDLISFETTIRMINKGFTFTEVPVSHRPRINGESRGLPLKKIPEVVVRILKCFPLIKRDIINNKYNAVGGIRA